MNEIGIKAGSQDLLLKEYAIVHARRRMNERIQKHQNGRLKNKNPLYDVINLIITSQRGQYLETRIQRLLRYLMHYRLKANRFVRLDAKSVERLDDLLVTARRQ